MNNTEISMIKAELDERQQSIVCNKKSDDSSICCDQNSLSGAVSQRACVYCGARVVLNPITDAIHLVHGPIGCAAYTWDIRGSLSSGGDNFYRNSFSTDLREKDIIFGGEIKLASAIDEIVESYKPKLIFVYSTCVVGVIGDDLDAICKQAENKHNIIVIPVQSTGFAGNKASGYKAASRALFNLMSRNPKIVKQEGINILGEFNLAGEIWILVSYLHIMGIRVIAKVTGDSTCNEIMQAPTAQFNIMQCAGSTSTVANMMQKHFNIPYFKVSFFGVSDTVNSLMKIAEFTKNPDIIDKTKKFTSEKALETNTMLEYYRKKLSGKKAAIYVGGGFKAISLIRQFNDLGINTVIVGTQTGQKEDYDEIKKITQEGTIIVDDTNPSELVQFIKQKNPDILVGGVKERPLAYKLGVSFCDHNHERKFPLCGFEGAINFAKEIENSINSPVWKMVKKDFYKISKKNSSW